MNWARGFFRLWIVLSILWVGSVLINRAFDVIGARQQASAAQEYFASDPNCAKTEWQDLKEDRCMLNRLRAKAANKRMTYSFAKSAKWVALAILPPIMLLGITIVLHWIYKGFHVSN